MTWREAFEDISDHLGRGSAVRDLHMDAHGEWHGYATPDRESDQWFPVTVTGYTLPEVDWSDPYTTADLT